MAKQNTIKTRLKSLEEIDGISVEVSGDSDRTICIKHEKVHAPEFRFRWNTDHFVGYFVDGKKKRTNQGMGGKKKRRRSQAVVSLYNGMDAIRFVTAYAILYEL